MKIKERIKNVGFWVSLISSIFLIVGAFGVEIADQTANDVINAVCSALVVLGIVSDPTAGKGYLDLLPVSDKIGHEDTELSDCAATVEVARVSASEAKEAPDAPKDRAEEQTTD